MTPHLLLITLGPVQDFIQQARRTRDLWYGSHLLSELSRTAARTLAEDGAQLIFPALSKGDGELAFCKEQLRSSQTPPQNIANKLLAEVPAGLDPQVLARAVRDEVTRFWRDEIAAEVRFDSAGLLDRGIDAVWDEQVSSLIEFNAAWLPLEDYPGTREQLERAIAGRKLLRDFDPWAHGRGKVRNSSLDGARETVLARKRDRDKKLVRKFRIAENEELDAVGLIKRAGGRPDQFVPVANVALARWIEHAHKVAGTEFSELIGACDDYQLGWVQRSDLPWTQEFPRVASILLEGRWYADLQEQNSEITQQEALAWGKEHVQPLYRKVGEPYPYVACLVADGDHMGRAINALNSADAHRRFSAALANFASAAREVVEQRFRGSLVYAGGDDVLAFLPLADAVACAQELRERFSGIISPALPEGIARPTLSVGLGVGHVNESMGDLLNLGRAAEREAKRDRNALAIIAELRSGGQHIWRATWDRDPAHLLHNAMHQVRSTLPSRKIYEISRLISQLPAPASDEAARADFSGVLAGEVRATLARVEGGPVQPEDVDLDLGLGAGYGVLHARVRDWAARFLIARVFERAVPAKNSTSEALA